MELTTLRVRGVTAFPTTTEIDFGSLGPGLVALVGGNGEGKTTLLEAPFAALYQGFASRTRSLYEYCRGDDAFIEAEFVTEPARELRARLAIDAERRRMEPYLFSRSGPGAEWAPVTRGKAAEYRDAVASLFGKRDLLLASVLRAQDKTGEFMQLKRGERKALFMAMLGLETLDTLRGLAAEEARQAFARRSDAHAALREMADAADDAERHESRSQEANTLLLEAHQWLTDAEAEAEAASEALQRYAAARDSLGEDPTPALHRARETFRLREARLTGRLREAEEVLADKERIEAAEGDLVLARNATSAFEQYYHAARAKHREGLDETARARQDFLIAESNKRQAQTALRSAREDSKLLAEVPCTSNTWAAFDGENEERLSVQPEIDLAGACPLLKKANRAAESLADLGDRLTLITRDHDARLGQIGKLEQRDRQNAKEVEEASGQLLDSRNRMGDLEMVCNRRAELNAAAKTSADCATDLRALRDDWGAEQQRLERAVQDFTAKRDALAALGDPAQLRAAHDLARRERDLARKDIENRTREVAEAKARADEARKRCGAVEEFEQARDRADDDLRDWELLTDALGPNGIQALEISAAAPAIAEITNDLLRATYGARFSLSFATLAEKRDGGQKEVFEVQVYDDGAVREASDLSGGEQAVVGEAISLGLAIYHARKSGVPWRTLWRDETAGALSPDNAERYVAMLRRALDVGGFRQIIFVAHVPAVWQGADHRVFVSDGAVRLA